MVDFARRSPRARLSSLVPRWSQCLSMRTSRSAFALSHAAFASSIFASSGRMSYLSKSKWMSCRSRTATNSEGTGRAAPEGLDAEDEPGAPAAGADPDGAGADRPAPDAALVAGGLPPPAAPPPRAQGGNTPRGEPPRPHQNPLFP